MLINVPDDLASRLEKLAQQEGTSVGDVLNSLLNRYAPEFPYGSLAELAQNAREAELTSDQTVDTAEKSREILNTEYADYLKRRMDTTPNDHHHQK